MKLLTFKTTAVAGLALLAGFAVACSSQSQVATSAQAIDRGHVSAGKARAAVAMTHELDGEPAVGRPLRLQAVFAADGYDSIRLDISADDALAAGPRINRSVSGGETVTIDMVPQAVGRYYVNVIAHIGAADRAQARVFSIPVQVGKGAYKSNATKATMAPDGERLVRMPAQEKPTD